MNWFYERREERNGTNYFVFHLGHDVSEPGESNQRFVTDAWLYVDSLLDKLFEYDIATDALTEWKK